MAKLVWKRTKNGYASACGKYAIQRYDSIMRGSAHLWELIVVGGPDCGADIKPLLRSAKRMAQKIEDTAFRP